MDFKKTSNVLPSRNSLFQEYTLKGKGWENLSHANRVEDKQQWIYQRKKTDFETKIANRDREGPLYKDQVSI